MGAAADFHIRLIDMRRETMFSVVAGMYHTWEKQLREWLVQELSGRTFWSCRTVRRNGCGRGLLRMILAEYERIQQKG
jgi:hypothetical protein